MRTIRLMTAIRKIKIMRYVLYCICGLLCMNRYAVAVDATNILAYELLNESRVEGVALTACAITFERGGPAAMVGESAVCIPTRIKYEANLLLLNRGNALKKATDGDPYWGMNPYSPCKYKIGQLILSQYHVCLDFL